MEENAFLNPNKRVPEQSTARVLKESKAEIIRLWEERVRRDVIASHDQSSLVMQNSIETFLDGIVRALLAQDSASPAESSSKLHGQGRAKFPGYFLPQLLQEYSIFRQVVVEVLLQNGVLTHKAHRLIDEAIDTSISVAATEFVKVQQAHTQEALTKAEISNRDLELFAGVAAHDLKSPLATISSYLDLLEEEVSDKEHAIQYIDFMKKASLRMRKLIDRLLEYALLTKTERPFISVDLNPLLESVLQNIQSTIEERKAKITTTSLPVVVGDPELLSQVFQNLFANALKFCKEDTPQIDLTVKKDETEGRWIFSIADNGIGFDPSKKEEIFTLYKKLHSDSKYQGTGIGLATCRKVIELHQGKIWAESIPGKGSTFYFSLPIDLK